MDSFGARAEFGEHEIFRLDALQQKYDVARLPYSLRVLLENLLRNEDGEFVTADEIEKVASWDAKAEPEHEIAYTPARVLMQDFTGVPAVVDLAAMREAMHELGGDPAKINPLVPAELVIDHSVQVDVYGSRLAFERNAELEFERNQERYAFLRWGQGAMENFRVVPPATGIVHQVNLEYLARVVFVDDRTGMAYPDTLVGTDSHTTMINGLGVLGWGVGGIEAEAAMLGQPMSMLIPQVLGFRLHGELPEGATATAGPGGAGRREGRLPRRAGRPHRPGRRGGDRPRPRRGDRRDLPRLRPPGQRLARPRGRPARARLGAGGGGGDRDRRALGDRGRGHARRRDV